MAILSSSSRDYIPLINSLNRPTYISTYGNQLNDRLNQILNGTDFVYDVESDPNYQKYKQNYVQLGKDAVKNAVANSDDLAGGFGNSYGARASAEANQQYITEMTERIPDLMNAAMQKYQMEKENNYKMFGTLQSEENRKYGQYRDTVSDYDKDLAGLTTGYNAAVNQENNQRAFDYQKARDAVSDSQWNQEFDYKKARDLASDDKWNQEFDYKASRDKVSDARAASELAYKEARAAVADEQWQKEFDLQQLKYENALKKAKSGGGRSRKRQDDSGADNSFFKMKGTANMKTYSGNNVDTSRNATLSVNKRNGFMNQLLSAKSESDAQKLLNRWAYDGQISEGDYDNLANLYNLAKERGIKQFTTGKKQKKRS